MRPLHLFVPLATLLLLTACRTTGPAPAPDTSKPITSLDDLRQWTVVSGQWVNDEKGGIIGSGNSLLRFNHPLPPAYTIEFTMVQMEGMRPRIELPGTDFYFGNEGYDKTLFVYGAHATDVQGTPISYANKTPLRIRVTLKGDAFAFTVNHKPVAKGHRTPRDGAGLTLQSGDGWSAGTTVFRDFRIVPTEGDLQ